MFDSKYAIISIVDNSERYYMDVIIYENENGKSELLDFLKDLESKSKKDKNARIQYKQIVYYIELLKNNFGKLPTNIAKHIDDGIWELRPGNNRIFYFTHLEKEIVLLHLFRKKSQKTPTLEIDKAKRERADYVKRSEQNDQVE